jgi:hypothetical protein
LGFPNCLAIIIIINYTPAIKPFSGAIAGEEVEDFYEGSFLHAQPLLCFKFCFTLFILLALFYQKQKKILVPSIVVIFVGLLLSCFIMLSIDLTSRKLDSEEDAEKLVELRLSKSEAGRWAVVVVSLSLFAHMTLSIRLRLIIISIIGASSMKFFPDAQLDQVVSCLWPIVGFLRHVDDSGN